MDELIFFFIPGLVVALTIIGTCPSVLSSKEYITALTFFSPLAGYTFHQLFRWLFEGIVGSNGKFQTVLTDIINFANDKSLPILKKTFGLYGKLEFAQIKISKILVTATLELFIYREIRYGVRLLLLFRMYFFIYIFLFPKQINRFID